MDAFAIGGLEEAEKKRLGVLFFNRCWDLMDLGRRTAEQDLDMLSCAHASFALWSSYGGATKTNLSIGLWQLSRVYSLVGSSELARAYAQRCISASRGEEVDSFYLAYGYEALARALRLAGDPEAAKDAVALAFKELEGSREDDLEAIRRDLRQLLE